MEKGAILVGEPMGLFIAQEEGELSDVERLQYGGGRSWNSM